jgi:4-hydroxythreonine-4-phosphate dehydrogenase
LPEQSKPRIVITTGDPAGIGPEIILKGLIHFKSVNPDFIPIVVGHAKTYISPVYSDFFTSLKIPILNSDDDSLMKNNAPIFIEPAAEIGNIKPGEGSIKSGAAAGIYLDTALELIRNGTGDILLTCPINKKYFQDAGYNYAGHTDYLKDRTGSPEAYMMFCRENIKVLLATHHVPLKKVPALIKKEYILKILRFLYEKGPLYGLTGLKIAVTGLNPHSGEEGILGSEDIEEIQPAITAAKEFFPNIEGPLPADSAFRPDVRKRFDLILVMYHDQGLTAVKSLGPSVNVTIGLPFIRVSPDHGTAYEIAGRFEADPSSFINAVESGLNLYYNSKSTDRIRK